MTTTETQKKSGVFYRKSTNDYIVLWQGVEVCSYPDIESFVEAHCEGLAALEANQADLLESYYRSIGVSTGKTPGA